jgi:hypothetical protein
MAAFPIAVRRPVPSVRPLETPGSEIFWGAIECSPYAEDPGLRVPVANIWLVDDYWLHGLDPAEIAGFAAQLRAHADRLDHEVRPALIAARADWNAQHMAGAARVVAR